MTVMVGLVVGAIADLPVHRLSTPAPVGGRRPSSTTRRMQTETTSAFTAQYRPSLLGRPPVSVERLDRRPHHRESRDDCLLAPRRIPAILATALPAARSTATQRRGHSLIRRTKMDDPGCGAAHPRRNPSTRLRHLGADRVALPERFEAAHGAREGQALDGLSERSSRGDRRRSTSLRFRP